MKLLPLKNVWGLLMACYLPERVDRVVINGKEILCEYKAARAWTVTPDYITELVPN